MKLIQILALATAMATMATAQNSSANGQNNGGPKPSPTATPAAAKDTKAKPKTTAKTTPAGAQSTAKPGSGTAAKATDSQASSNKPAAPASKPAATAKSGAVSGSKTVAAKTASGPVKPKGTTNSVKAKGTPTPVVQANIPAKADAKKADAAKHPAVIAVKPVPAHQVKKTGGTQAKTPAKPSAPTVTQVGPPAKPAEKPKPTVTRSFGAHGRRDPFVSPIRAGRSDLPSPTCATGKRCLAIPELVLQGTVKDTSGKMMAVVANSTKHTYFMRENDQVFNGNVEKITSDSIIFREFIKDALGRETAREVVKKLVVAAP
ncbi:MAG: pilus assembly protein PilP [Candidatus Angelobacter sp.]